MLYSCLVAANCPKTALLSMRGEGAGEESTVRTNARPIRRCRDKKKLLKNFQKKKKIGSSSSDVGLVRRFIGTMRQKLRILPHFPFSGTRPPDPPLGYPHLPRTHLSLYHTPGTPPSSLQDCRHQCLSDSSSFRPDKQPTRLHTSSTSIWLRHLQLLLRAWKRSHWEQVQLAV